MDVRTTTVGTDTSLAAEVSDADLTGGRSAEPVAAWPIVHPGAADAGTF